MTAVTVSQVLPSFFAQMIPQLQAVVNDDDIGPQAGRSATLTNGLMLSEYLDIEGENRQAFYFGADSKTLP